MWIPTSFKILKEKKKKIENNNKKQRNYNKMNRFYLSINNNNRFLFYKVKNTVEKYKSARKYGN